MGEFSAELVSPLIFWTADDYRKQWVEAAKRTVNCHERSCFITTMRKSSLDGAILMWTAYRFGEAVYFQHKLLLPEIVKGSFELLNPCTQVDERRTKSEESEPISEWQVSAEDIARFLHAG